MPMQNDQPLHGDGPTITALRNDAGTLVREVRAYHVNGVPMAVGYRRKSLLELYLARRIVTGVMFEAGVRMTTLAYLAGRIPTIPVNYAERIGGGLHGYNPTDTRMDAARKLDAAYDAISQEEGALIRTVCIDDASPSSWRKMRILKGALDRLAGHFGFKWVPQEF